MGLAGSSSMSTRKEGNSVCVQVGYSCIALPLTVPESPTVARVCQLCQCQPHKRFPEAAYPAVVAVTVFSATVFENLFVRASGFCLCLKLTYWSTRELMSVQHVDK